jgi:hypothetical protein
MFALILPALMDIINKLIPDPAQKAAAQLQMMQLAQSGELAQMEAVKALNLAQIDVNKSDAQSPRAYQANARPTILWVCGAALAWDTVLRPALTFGAAMAGHPLPPMPTLSSDQLYGLLTGLLGLGAMRTAEKIKGAAV